MTHLQHLHHVALTVRDRDASSHWYRTVLGLVELFHEDGDERRACVLGFAGGGFAVGLVEHVLGPHDALDPTRTGLDHLAFTVGTRAGLDAWAARLEAHGVPHSGVIDVPGRGILNAKDPDGIALSFFWDAPA